jgi:membrane protein
LGSEGPRLFAAPGNSTMPDDHAAAPSVASRRGWRRWLSLAWRFVGDIFADRVQLIAAGVTFFVILALFPGLGALISIYGLFADPARLAAHLDLLQQLAPGGAIDVLHDQLARLAATGRGTLGFGFVASLAISLWSANAGVKALFEALNVMFREQERRNLIVLNAVGLLFTVGILGFVLGALGLLVLLPIVFAYLPHLNLMASLFALARWPLLFGLATLALNLLFRYGPSRSRRMPHWITPGSVTAALLWLAASALFSWYVANFGSYNRTYGSLGAIFGFMTWMWVSIITVLVGAKIDAQLAQASAGHAADPELPDA